LQRKLDYLTEYYNINVIQEELAKINQADAGHAIILKNELYRELQVTIAFLMSYFLGLDAAVMTLDSFTDYPDYGLFRNISMVGKHIEENGSNSRNFILKKGEEKTNAAKQVITKYINISNMQKIAFEYKTNPSLDNYNLLFPAFIAAKQVNKILLYFLNTPRNAKESYPFKMLQTISLIHFFNEGNITNELIAIQAIEEAEKDSSAPTSELLLIDLYQSIQDGLFHIMKEINSFTQNLIISSILQLANFENTGIAKDILAQKSKKGEQNKYLNNAETTRLKNLGITHQHYRMLFTLFNQCVILADLLGNNLQILKKQRPHDTVVFSSIQQFTEVFFPDMLLTNFLHQNIAAKTELPTTKPLKITEASPALTHGLAMKLLLLNTRLAMKAY
jgi:hypothetical protein